MLRFFPCFSGVFRRDFGPMDFQVSDIFSDSAASTGMMLSFYNVSYGMWDRTSSIEPPNLVM